MMGTTVLVRRYAGHEVRLEPQRAVPRTPVAALRNLSALPPEALARIQKRLAHCIPL